MDPTANLQALAGATEMASINEISKTWPDEPAEKPSHLCEVTQ